jgi:hypothetical protein
VDAGTASPLTVGAIAVAYLVEGVPGAVGRTYASSVAGRALLGGFRLHPRSKRDLICGLETTHALLSDIFDAGRRIKPLHESHFYLTAEPADDANGDHAPGGPGPGGGPRSDPPDQPLAYRGRGRSGRPAVARGRECVPWSHRRPERDGGRVRKLVLIATTPERTVAIGASVESGLPDAVSVERRQFGSAVPGAGSGARSGRAGSGGVRRVLTCRARPDRARSGI